LRSTTTLLITIGLVGEPFDEDPMLGEVGRMVPTLATVDRCDLWIIEPLQQALQPAAIFRVAMGTDIDEELTASVATAEVQRPSERKVFLGDVVQRNGRVGGDDVQSPVGRTRINHHDLVVSDGLALKKFEESTDVLGFVQAANDDRCGRVTHSFSTDMVTSYVTTSPSSSHAVVPSTMASFSYFGGFVHGSMTTTSAMPVASSEPTRPSRRKVGSNRPSLDHGSDNRILVSRGPLRQRTAKRGQPSHQ
jgi:hypothetical protein